MPQIPITLIPDSLCYSSGASGYTTSGCEHFGVHLAESASPDAWRYSWLVQNVQGNLVAADSNAINKIEWSTEGNVLHTTIFGEISSSSQCSCAECCELYGEPRWIESCVAQTTSQTDIDDISEVSVSQCQWLFLQIKPTCDEDCSPIQGGGDVTMDIVPGEDTKSVVRHLKLWEYTGQYSDWNEADPRDRNSPRSTEVGNYVGTHMTALKL